MKREDSLRCSQGSDTRPFQAQVYKSRQAEFDIMLLCGCSLFLVVLSEIRFFKPALK